MVQHTRHDWPTTAELNTPSRSIAHQDELDRDEQLDLDTHEGAMTGLVTGELELSPETRKVMGLD